MAALVALALVYWGRIKQMTKWIEYTGSDEQIEEINRAKHGVLAKNNFNHIWPDIYEHFDFAPIGATEYLICDPHPYADLIDIWRLTGCEVWTKFSYEYVGFLYKELPEDTLTRLNEDSVIVKTTKPNWNIPGAEYRLTPFED